MMWLPRGKETEQTVFRNYELPKILLKLRKWSPSPIAFYHLPSQNLPAYRDHKERLVLMSARGRVTAVEPQGFHWYLGACAGHWEREREAQSTGVLCPLAEAVSALGEFPLGYSCCFLGKMWYVWAETSSRNELPRANSFCKLLLRR